MRDLSTLRSLLFVPGDRPERFAKAAASGADAVILDLEDAVAPTDKTKARDHVRQFLDQATDETILVRINDAGSSFFHHDLSLTAHPSLAGVILPKANAQHCSDLLSRSRAPVWPLIESAEGLTDLKQIVGQKNQGARLGRLLLGSIDLSADLGLDMAHPGGQSALNAARFMLVTNSRAANLAAPIDGVVTNLDDETALQNAAEHASASGMGGMMCIHPRQIATVHAGFAPDDIDIAWATNVLAAAKTAKGSFRFQGHMVDKPVLDRATRILASLDTTT